MSEVVPKKEDKRKPIEVLYAQIERDLCKYTDVL